MDSRTKTVPVTATRTVLEDIDVLQIRQDRPETNSVRRHDSRLTGHGEEIVTPVLSQASSSLGILPEMDMDALAVTDLYIEDDMFASDLWRTPDLQLTGAKAPDEYIKNNLNPNEGEDLTLLPSRPCGHTNDVMLCLWGDGRSPRAGSGFGDLNDQNNSNDLLNRLRELCDVMDTVRGTDGDINTASQCSSLPVTVISPPSIHPFDTRNVHQYQNLISEVVSTYQPTHPLMGQATPIY